MFDRKGTVGSDRIVITISLEIDYVFVSKRDPNGVQITEGQRTVLQQI